MAQGKLKVKTKMPNSVNTKKKTAKNSATMKRANCPIQPKKKNNAVAQKLRKMISKTVNKTVEEEIRNMAYNSTQNLSKVQQAVVEHHSKSEVKT